MSSRGSKQEEEKRKLINEKLQVYLAEVLREEDNRYCADCDAKGPRWASWNLGVFLCIRCAGIHRNLGVHVSKVKSVNLDSWTPEQVQSMRVQGNSIARAVYEANLPDHFRRPQSDSSMESFIRAKYDHKRYIMKDWVKPVVSVIDLPCYDEIQDIQKGITTKSKKSHSHQQTAAPKIPSLGKPINTNVSSPQKKMPSPQAVPQSSSGVADLLNLSDPTPPAANPTPPSLDVHHHVANNSSMLDLGTLDMTAPGQAGTTGPPAAIPHNNSFPRMPGVWNLEPTPAPPAAVDANSGMNNEQLLGEMTANPNDKKTNSDILALYAAGGNKQAPPQQGVQGVMFPPQQGVQAQFGLFQSTPYSAQAYPPPQANPAFMISPQGQPPNNMYPQIAQQVPGPMGNMGINGPFAPQQNNPQMIQQQLAALNLNRNPGNTNTMANNLWQ